ncbi:hypothetical protein D3C81_1981630 [compost metagenome]
MLHFAKAIQADDLAGQMEAGDLRAAILERHVRLERAEAHGIDGGKRIAHAIQRFALVHAHAFLHERVHLQEVLLRHAYRQTKLTHPARGAAGRDLGDGNGGKQLRALGDAHCSRGATSQFYRVK